MPLGQGHKRYQKRATLYNYDIPSQIALLTGLRREESVRDDVCRFVVGGCGSITGVEKEEEEEEDSIHSDGSLSDDAGGADWGAAAGGGAWCGGMGIGWAMYNGTPKKGATESKRGLRSGTAKAIQKRMYKWKQEEAVRYKVSRNGL